MNEERLKIVNSILQNLAIGPPIKVEAYDESAGDIKLWFAETPDPALMSIRSLEDASAIRALAPAHILRWQRAAAASKRVWQIRDREYREWKAAKVVEYRTPPADGKGWKAPTQAACEAKYRADPNYSKMSSVVEGSEEAHSACLGVIDAWGAVVRLLAPGEDN